jgi:hypothetical protein
MMTEGAVVCGVFVAAPSQLPGILIILEIDGMLELFKI